MNRQQIDLLLDNQDMEHAEVIETHISWLLLTPDKVYKMKKDVLFSFLDFSTLASRKFYCEHELKLNQRLAPDLYEDVVAINASEGGLEFGAYRVDSIDYAIRMRRVAPEWEMTRMLKEGRVLPEHMDQLADQLAAFHQGAKSDKSLFDPIQILDAFNDIVNYSQILVSHIGPAGMEELMDGMKAVRSFLQKHQQRFHERRSLGLTVDGHGDLHAANVFLENNKPIIFDCIEFNDEFRKVDVLDEIAFLYVDLEANDRLDLADRFASSYQSCYPTILTKEDERLFDFYKCYRANVRLKVTAIKIDNLPSKAFADELLNQLHRYHKIYHRYADRLNKYNGETLQS
jgi:aminoglycoside phosphotransferase family enzyme